MRAFTWSLVCSLIILTPAFGQGKKKPNTAPAVPATPEEYTQLNQQKEVLGKIVAIAGDGRQDNDKDVKGKGKGKGKDAKDKDSKDKDTKTSTTKTLTFRYEYEQMEANPNYRPTPAGKVRDYTKDYQKLQTQMQKALTIKDPFNQQTAILQIQQQMQALILKAQQEQFQQSIKDMAAKQKDIENGNVPYISVGKAKEFQIEIQSNVVVRRLKPAMEYDDRGFIKEYSKAELDKLHLVDNADKKKPGYPAKYEDLMPGQQIVVGLMPTKKGDKNDPAASPRPTVRMIAIVEDIPNPNNVPTNTLPKR